MYISSYMILDSLVYLSFIVSLSRMCHSTDCNIFVHNPKLYSLHVLRIFGICYCIEPSFRAYMYTVSARVNAPVWVNAHPPLGQYFT